MSLWRAADGLCKQDPPQPRAVSCWTEERTGASPQCCLRSRLTGSLPECGPVSELHPWVSGGPS